MKKLYSIMEELLIVEAELNALKTVTSIIIENYKSQEKQNEEDILYVINIYLEYVNGNMRKSINTLDEFLATRKKG
ncbi:hypothetical protein [Eubacterium sp. An3]|uniref:hypothetical protein n=1 Tax=Eubacterium sp. An3 TaxID=1965628 RepID=UPI000B3AB840|nr:hypothetical protein [Eubacterium sp. An3]OUO29626.1 hypothetical protein B5F87_03740 [Eubacterium sp. An3]